MEPLLKERLELFKRASIYENKFTEPVREYFEISNKINGNLLNLTHEEQSLFLEAIVNGRFVKEDEVSKKELKENVLGTNPQHNNQTICWFFSRRVATYLSGVHKVEVKDLKNQAYFKKIGPVCDYMIVSDTDGTINLYELKSIYKEGDGSAGVSDIACKIKSLISKFQGQLTNTERHIGSTAVKHFCVDISRYVDNFDELKPSLMGGIKFAGFTDSDIDNVMSEIDITEFDIDNLSICWKKTFYHSETGTPIGILYDCASKVSRKDNIGWWIQEAYFTKDNPGVLTEYREAFGYEHSNTKGMNYFCTAFNNYYDEPSFWGEWTDVK